VIERGGRVGTCELHHGHAPHVGVYTVLLRGHVVLGHALPAHALVVLVDDIVEGLATCRAQNIVGRHHHHVVATDRSIHLLHAGAIVVGRGASHVGVVAAHRRQLAENMCDDTGPEAQLGEALGEALREALGEVRLVSPVFRSADLN